MITSFDGQTAGPLGTTDRCDRCADRARVLVVLTTGGELVFCEHHAWLRRAALEPIAARFEHDADRTESV